MGDSLPPGGWLKSPAGWLIPVYRQSGWLPVHRNQFRAQRSVTSMGSLYLLPIRYSSSLDMGVNHEGGRGDKFPRIWSGDANANFLPRFCYVLKFQAPDCLHCNAVKSLLTPWLWQSIHYFPKVHLQRPPNHHFNIFFWRGHGQKYRS